MKIGVLSLQGAVREHVAAPRQEKLLVSSFHPELTEDARMHSYFVEMDKGKREKRF